MEKVYVSSLDTSMYCLGIGHKKFDVTRSPRFYSDMAIAAIGCTWLTN